MKVATLENSISRLIPQNVSQATPISHNEVYDKKFYGVIGKKNISNQKINTIKKHIDLKKYNKNLYISQKVASHINKTPKWFLDFSEWFVKNYGTRRMPNETDFINFVRYKTTHATKEWFYNFAMFFKEYYNLTHTGKSVGGDEETWWDRFFYWFKDRSANNGSGDNEETWWDRFFYWFKDRSANNGGGDNEETWWDRFFYWFKDRSINHDWWNYFLLWFKNNIVNNKTLVSNKDIVDFINFLKSKFENNEKQSGVFGVENELDEGIDISDNKTENDVNTNNLGVGKNKEDEKIKYKNKKISCIDVVKYVGIASGIAVITYLVFNGLKNV